MTDVRQNNMNMLRWCFVWGFSLLAIFMGLIALLLAVMPFIQAAFGTYDGDGALSPFFAFFVFTLPAGVITGLCFLIAPDRRCRLLKVTLGVVAGPPVLFIGALLLFIILAIAFKLLGMSGFGLIRHQLIGSVTFA